ncbi:hypothetical protein [Chitinophaga flava]|uniref:Uncharacterized protein n=1 Tax=Chitinophaga flava TaxID=2259036 RepID=A0A365XVQ6_9BACT|nr:hypothetical protein [Chitinophaga flava]RBL89804.1 hypothetical protein DF182_25295 [Chitinophaga flava]
MKKFFFQAIACISLLVLSLSGFAQEFKTKEIERYFEQSKGQVTVSLENKKFVFVSSDGRSEKYRKPMSSASFRAGYDNKLTIFSWGEPITAGNKIMEDLKASGYTLIDSNKAGNMIANTYAKPSKDIKVGVLLRPATQMVSVAFQKGE